ncbi:MAG: flagellar export protein FliJ [Lachnospiraceae bacterium]|jgi:flagellar FliJ protein|nr:flagellar export protein FliJ [Lachnospiraceae bacterium]
MKKFVYSMQSILNLQYKIEDQQKASFREASEKLRAEEERLRELMNQQSEYEDQLKELMNGVLDLPGVRVKKHDIDIMKSRVRTQMLNVHMAEKNMEAARIRLTQAMIDRKTQERMKEKAFDAYKIELAQEESKEIDQLVSYKHSV